jgi:hypothetical protein
MRRFLTGKNGIVQISNIANIKNATKGEDQFSKEQ